MVEAAPDMPPHTWCRATESTRTLGGPVAPLGTGRHSPRLSGAMAASGVKDDKLRLQLTAEQVSVGGAACAGWQLAGFAR